MKAAPLALATVFLLILAGLSPIVAEDQGESKVFVSDIFHVGEKVVVKEGAVRERGNYSEILYVDRFVCDGGVCEKVGGGLRISGEELVVAVIGLKTKLDGRVKVEISCENELETHLRIGYGFAPPAKDLGDSIPLSFAQNYIEEDSKEFKIQLEGYIYNDFALIFWITPESSFKLVIREVKVSPDGLLVIGEYGMMVNVKNAGAFFDLDLDGLQIIPIKDGEETSFTVYNPKAGWYFKSTSTRISFNVASSKAIADGVIEFLISPVNGSNPNFKDIMVTAELPDGREILVPFIVAEKAINIYARLRVLLPRIPTKIHVYYKVPSQDIVKYSEENVYIYKDNFLKEKTPYHLLYDPRKADVESKVVTAGKYGGSLRITVNPKELPVNVGVILYPGRSKPVVPNSTTRIVVMISHPKAKVKVQTLDYSRTFEGSSLTKWGIITYRTSVKVNPPYPMVILLSLEEDLRPFQFWIDQIDVVNIRKDVEVTVAQTGVKPQEQKVITDKNTVIYVLWGLSAVAGALPATILVFRNRRKYEEIKLAMELPPTRVEDVRNPKVRKILEELKKRKYEE